MNSYTILVGIGIIVTGILIIFVRMKRYKWFNNLYRVREMEQAVGKKGTDIIYLICAIILWILGIWLIFWYK